MLLKVLKNTIVVFQGHERSQDDASPAGEVPGPRLSPLHSLQCHKVSGGENRLSRGGQRPRRGDERILNHRGSRRHRL